MNLQEFIHRQNIFFQIESGSLQATYNLGDGPTTIILSNVPANDGQWHRVTVERMGKELMLKMDSGEGRYYVEAIGPDNGHLDLSVKQTEVFSGANLIYSQGAPDIFVGNEQDLISCKYLYKFSLFMGFTPMLCFLWLKKMTIFENVIL